MLAIATRLLRLAFIATLLSTVVTTSLTAEELRIGAKESIPFTTQVNDEWQGLTFDLWRTVAADLGVDYSVKEYSTIEALLQAVADGDIDVAVGPITVNAQREQLVDFSHTYFNTGLGIATAQQDTGVWSMVLHLASLDFLSAVFSLLMVLLLVGVIIWFLERRRNQDQFGGNALEGIGSGFWWSAVTMTTVGYGDKAPVTPMGRLVGLVWMFVSVIMVSSFTAAIASSITVQNLSSSVNGVEDLYRAQVGTVEGSSSVQYLERRGIRYAGYGDVNELVEALKSEEVDAVVFDVSLLKYTIREEDYADLRVLPVQLLSQDYAFAFATESEWIEPFNRELLTKIAAESWQRTKNNYFGSK